MKVVVQAIVVFSYCICANAQTITTIAGIGSGSSSGEGGPATLAHTPLPFSGAFDNEGNYYYSESAGTPHIRRINSLGIITTVAGNGVYGYGGDDGPATLAQIKNAFITVDFSGNIIIADNYNNRLRKVDAATGIITTIAGNGTAGSTGDGGPATAALIRPADAVADVYGNLFVSEEGGSGGGGNIRKINASGIISHVTNINALGMAFGKGGYLYLGCNLYVFRLDTVTGHIDTVAGTGVATYNGDEIPATTANFKVFDLAIDKIGNIYLADVNDSRVRQIDTFGIIHTIAGTGVGGFSGDGGPATAAQIYSPEGVAVDACGSVYIADKSNNRIRKVAMPVILTVPTIAISNGEGDVTPIGSTVTVSATVSNAGSSYFIRWMNNGIVFATTTIPMVTYTKGIGIDTITAKIVSTSTYGCYDSTVSAPVFIDDGSTFVISFSEEQNFVIYPNPVKDKIVIESISKMSSIHISNCLGQVVYEQQYTGKEKVEVEVRHLPPGMYMVRVNGVYVGRFMKE